MQHFLISGTFSHSDFATRKQRGLPPIAVSKHSAGRWRRDHQRLLRIFSSSRVARGLGCTRIADLPNGPHNRRSESTYPTATDRQQLGLGANWGNSHPGEWISIGRSVFHPQRITFGSLVGCDLFSGGDCVCPSTDTKGLIGRRLEIRNQTCRREAKCRRAQDHAARPISLRRRLAR